MRILLVVCVIGLAAFIAAAAPSGPTTSERLAMLEQKVDILTEQLDDVAHAVRAIGDRLAH